MAKSAVPPKKVAPTKPVGVLKVFSGEVDGEVIK